MTVEGPAELEVFCDGDCQIRQTMEATEEPVPDEGKVLSAWRVTVETLEKHLWTADVDGLTFCPGCSEKRQLTPGRIVQ